MKKVSIIAFIIVFILVIAGVLFGVILLPEMQKSDEASEANAVIVQKQFIVSDKDKADTDQ